MTWLMTFGIGLAGAVVAAIVAIWVRVWLEGREWKPEEEGPDY